jgi:transposase
LARTAQKRERVAQSAEAGAYAVTAFSPGRFPLQDEHARAFEVIKWLKAQRARAGKIWSTRAFFSHQEKSYEVRVIALRRTAEQTEQMRRQKCKKASKKQRGIQSGTWYLAGWLLVLTTLPAADWSAVEVLSLYRARWHIELLFKRIKQLLSQHRLRAETEETALATVYAIVVSWVMQQEVACEMRSLLSQLYAQVQEEKKAMSEQMGKPLDEEEQAISEWRLQTWSEDRFPAEGCGQKYCFCP